MDSSSSTETGAYAFTVYSSRFRRPLDIAWNLIFFGVGQEDVVMTCTAAFGCVWLMWTHDHDEVACQS